MEKQELSTPLTEERLKFFLDSRKGAKDQCLEILHIILQKENQYNDGWVPFQDIKEHMDKKFTKEDPVWEKLSDGRKVHLQKKRKRELKIPKIPREHLTRLLEDMEDLNIVKKKKEKDTSLKTPNKDRIFYKCRGDAITPIFTRIGMAQDYPRLYRKNIELSNNLGLALCILDEHGLIEEYNAKIEERKVISEKRKHQTRDEILSEITNMTLEEVQERNSKIDRGRKHYLSKDLKKLKEEKK